jgi:hypothetical protein
VLPFGLLSLAMSVWIIYTVDHLLDAIKIAGPASTERHRFHQRNFTALCVAVVFVIIADLVVVMFIRPAVLKGGFVLIGICVLYLVAHRFIKFPKELLIAFLYTAGVLLPSLSVTSLPFNQWPFPVIVQFMLTALLNLNIFSWFDRERDRKDGNVSIVSLMGEKHSKTVLWFVLAVSLSIAFFSTDIVSTMLMSLMNIILMFIFLNRKMFMKDEKFRLLGDAVFYIPAIYLFL